MIHSSGSVMDRRTLLKTGSLAVLGLGFGGCASRPVQPAAPTARRPMIRLAPIRASWDRVIRTTVGLRPHRPSGFTVRAQKLDGKLLVHDYGHGGAGLSLTWGTGAMAADLALSQNGRRAAVIGSGVAGLTAARQLQRRGFDVTIYAMAVPPDTTSNMAYGGFTPTSGLVSRDGATPAWEAEFRQAVDIAYKELQLLAGRDYGVSWLDSYSTREELPTGADEEDDEDALLPAHIRPIRTGGEILNPGEHPFDAPYAIRRPAMRIEPSIYLDALMRDVREFGGRTVIRKFDTVRDLMTLGEPVIVNCAGLGSRDLFGDQELIPVKGQLTFLVPQPEVDYQFGCNPRSDGIALGSTREPNVWSLEPDPEARQRIVNQAIERFAAMRAPDPMLQLTRSRAPAAAPGVESFFGMES